ncbi:hypothetical protein UA08_05720 [Talaromyces atroroseus]|uniref:Xylanolytic transcriptional activator regulatory domain-containing protein n=1 Tax=Talaromyces atroroseus TaxID=1441469 RepID=A0A225APD2_TALAT|nr:hypothetical protein UA08_05720 [Talaromyces atroroseus]OKL59148.1 hypothetical protein UA08_05720 [Talaromyces atroroseus]
MSKNLLGPEARRRRQVRCDWSRLVCMRCLRGGRSCEYTNVVVPTIEFIPYRGQQDIICLTSSSETWKSVIEQQATSETQQRAQDIPFRTLSEGEGGRQRAGESYTTQPAIPAEILAPKSISDYPFVPISSLGDAVVSSVWTKLPSRDGCKSVFESFVLTIHPIIPVCHIPTLRKVYSKFWDDLSPNTSAELLLLVLAILYTNVANSSDSEASIQSSAIHELYDELAHALDLSSYYVTQSPSSIMLLQGFLIMNTFRAGHLAPFTAFGFLPITIRFAQSLRLHVDQNTESDVDRDVQRRLWWHLVFLDVESTIASGLPAIISSVSFTTKIPSITWDDAAVGSEANNLSPMMIAMQGHWEWACRMQIWYERKPEQHEITYFGRVMENLLKMLGESGEDEWARVYLQMLIDRAYCMLGLRFWQLDLFKGMDCHSEIVRTSRSFLERFLRLATLPQSLRRDWFVPGLIQPIHALIVLLVHLDGCTCPDEEAILSKDLIDQVISLRQGRIVNRGHSINLPTPRFKNLRQHNSRYLTLISLKTRVWHKLGWLAPYASNPQDEPDGGLGINQPYGATLNPDIDVGFGSEYPTENSISALWDDFVAGASLDANTTDWDEWNHLSAGVFME